MSAEDDGAAVTPPNAARIYDAMLGGRDNYPSDRAVLERVEKLFPHVRTAAVENRRFMARAVRYVADRGVDQFVDIGAGLPTSTRGSCHLHEAVQEVRPASRVVYVDNDPNVYAYAQALMRSTGAAGRVGYVLADLRQPRGVLDSPEFRALDHDRPIALSVVAVLHYLQDKSRPYQVMRTLIDALPAGSCVILTYVTAELLPEDSAADMDAVVELYRELGIEAQARSREEVLAFFDGLTVVSPGLVPVHRWPDEGHAGGLSDAQVCCFGGVGVKPGRGVS